MYPSYVMLTLGGIVKDYEKGLPNATANFEYLFSGGSTIFLHKITEIQSLSPFKQMLVVCICFNKCYRF